MSKYTVKNISDIFGVNEETVRRWIRTDKLHATINSKRQGYVVEDSDLKEFLHNKTKYLKKYRKYKMSILIKRATEALKKPEVREDLARYLITQQMLLNMKKEAARLPKVEG